MPKFLEKILKLSLSSEDEKVLQALKDSEVTSRKVIGRGTLTVKASDITASKNFKAYSEKASKIFSAQR